MVEAAAGAAGPLHALLEDPNASSVRKSQVSSISHQSPGEAKSLLWPFCMLLAHELGSTSPGSDPTGKHWQDYPEAT